VHPQTVQESIVRKVFLLGGRYLEVGVVHLVVLDRFCRRRLKRSTFGGKKVHPRQNPGYAYAVYLVLGIL